MPIYEYRCVSCDEHFEKLQKSSDPPLEVCEDCGGELQKQWSLSGFQFKGEGWYVTDYGKNNGKDSAKESAEPEKKAPEESTTKPKSASKEDIATTPKKEKASD